MLLSVQFSCSVMFDSLRLVLPGPGPETNHCSCYPHILNSSKSLCSSHSHSLFHYPLHCRRPQRCLLCYPFMPRLSRPLCLYLDWSRQSSSQQLTWTVLPQGFCASPYFFGQALASDLTSLDLTLSTVLQYVDDLLLCVVLRLHTLNNTLNNSSIF